MKYLIHQSLEKQRDAGYIRRAKIIVGRPGFKKIKDKEPSLLAAIQSEARTTLERMAGDVLARMDAVSLGALHVDELELALRRGDIIVNGTVDRDVRVVEQALRQGFAFDQQGEPVTDVWASAEPGLPVAPDMDCARYLEDLKVGEIFEALQTGDLEVSGPYHMDMPSAQLIEALPDYRILNHLQEGDITIRFPAKFARPFFKAGSTRQPQQVGVTYLVKQGHLEPFHVPTPDEHSTPGDGFMPPVAAGQDYLHCQVIHVMPRELTKGPKGVLTYKNPYGVDLRITKSVLDNRRMLVGVVGPLVFEHHGQIIIVHSSLKDLKNQLQEEVHLTPKTDGEKHND